MRGSLHLPRWRGCLAGWIRVLLHSASYNHEGVFDHLSLVFFASAPNPISVKATHSVTAVNVVLWSLGSILYMAHAKRNSADSLFTKYGTS